MHKFTIQRISDGKIVQVEHTDFGRLEVKHASGETYPVYRSVFKFADGSEITSDLDAGVAEAAGDKKSLRRLQEDDAHLEAAGFAIASIVDRD